MRDPCPAAHGAPKPSTAAACLPQALRRRLAELAFILANHGTRWDELWERIGFAECMPPPAKPPSPPTRPASPAARVVRSFELAAALRSVFELDAREFDDALLHAYVSALDRGGTVRLRSLLPDLRRLPACDAESTPDGGDARSPTADGVRRSARCARAPRVALRVRGGYVAQGDVALPEFEADISARFEPLPTARPPPADPAL
jgi:hypothetical protein